MLRGDRSKTAAGGDDGDDSVPRGTLPCAGGGDLDTKQFVRVQELGPEAVVAAVVSSSDSVKSMTLVSLPLTVHAAVAAASGTVGTATDTVVDLTLGGVPVTHQRPANHRR